MEVIEVAKLIEAKIQLLEKGRQKLMPLALERAHKLAAYDKELGITELKLRSGQELLFEGLPVKDVAITLTKDIAKSICWQQKLEMEKADTEYTLAIKKLACVEAELNAYQSIFKHLAEI